MSNIFNSDYSYNIEMSIWNLIIVRNNQGIHIGVEIIRFQFGIWLFWPQYGFHILTSILNLIIDFNNQISYWNLIIPYDNHFWGGRRRCARLSHKWLFTCAYSRVIINSSDYWNVAYLQWCQLAILPNHGPQQISTREALVKNFWQECEWPKFYHRPIGRHKWFQTNSNVPYFDLSCQKWTKCQIQLLHVGFLFVLVPGNNFPNVVARLKRKIILKK